MKRLIFLGLLVFLAVALTLVAQENTGKVVVFAGQYRIDFSLNFAVVGLCVAVAVVWMSLGALRASGRLPSKIRDYWSSRGLKKLRQADNDALAALIAGDELLADKALKRATGSGQDSQNSYLLRALSALQAGRVEVAQQQLDCLDPSTLERPEAHTVLSARVALAAHQYDKALELIANLKPAFAFSPQVLRLKLFAYRGLGKWADALAAFRSSSESNPMPRVKSEEVLGDIYNHLTKSIATPQAMKELQSQATNGELGHASVVVALGLGLLKVGCVTEARQLVERALEQKFSSALLPAYQEIAMAQSREALVFVEGLISKHPGQIKLLEIAAQVCEQEQLWGKAIARFESLYAQLPSAQVAGRLERLYDLAGQPDRSAQWREKLHNHLGVSRQLA